MKLTRLELSGFKSFADTVELVLEDGITAIVGPNGCGKSNISDAVRWVLGEQRPRVLRGTRMDELIFQGSVHRRAINVVDVSMYFDNSESVLDVPYSEVVVTRRLSRNGQSDYLLNQSPVRLRDLQDLLRGTGLGANAGVVIEARMIDRLLSDRPEERRSLFEEAAGIGIYRDRRATTERRLERTAEDLQRLEDLISEVQTQVRSLARQRGKTERYDRFRKERFDAFMTLIQRDLESFDLRKRELDRRREELDRKIPTADETLSRREREREAKIQARAGAMARHADLERRASDARLELERLEGDLKLLTERMEHASERRSRATEERAHAEARAAQALRELDAAQAELAQAAAARESVQMELDLKASDEGAVKERYREQRERVRDLEAKLQRHAEEHRSLAGERAAIERELEQLTIRLASQEQAREEARRELESSEAALAAARQRLSQAGADEKAQAVELERTREAVAAAREAESQARHDHRALQETMAQRRAREEALRQLERQRDGLAPAARRLLEERHSLGGEGILGPLSDYLDLPPDQAATAERLLADWLHAVLVRDMDTVEVVRRWHQAAKPGPLALLPVDPGPRQRPKARHLPISVAATDPAQPWVNALLAGAKPLDDSASAIEQASGAVLLAGAEAQGPLGRRAELEALTRELAEEERHYEQLSADLENASQAHAQAEQALQAARERQARAAARSLEAQGHEDEASRHRLRAERRHSEADAACHRAREQLAERQSRLSEVNQQLGAGEDLRSRLEEELESKRAVLADLEAQQEAARERRVHWQVEEAQVSAREYAARQLGERAQAALDEARQEITVLERELQTIESGTGDARGRRSWLQDTLAERRATIQELESAVEDAARTVEKSEQEVVRAETYLQEVREERDVLTQERHRLELELAEAEGRRRALVERAEGEWHKPLDTLLREATPVEADTETLRREVQRLADAIEALGPVNPLALQEHAEEKARLEFLTAQRDDLAKARESLLAALKEIDETARALFMDTFNAVRENFHSVFQTLFEGGQCDISLADGDPLTSDIEIQAAPRGKRTQRIHLLSSGERALVAISLLFSIYLAKPAPFCLLDEVDAPLDDANVLRFVRLLNEFKDDTQFIVITHNPRTMQVADAVYGVTMQEPGVSTIVGVRLGAVEHDVA